jgi:hypothetical protein
MALSPLYLELLLPGGTEEGIGSSVASGRVAELRQTNPELRAHHFVASGERMKS